MKSIYLHIGMHKTGSTSIQLSLAAARAALRDAGVLYPGSDPNHAELFFAFCDAPAQEHRNLRRGLDTPGAALAHSRNQLAILSKEIRSSRCDQVVLSAEGLWSLSERGISRLAEFLRDFSDQINVVCLVRSPVRFATSYAQEDVIGGKLIADSLKYPELPQYRAKLSRYMRVFDGKPRVRSFDDIVRRREPLIDHFFQLIDRDAREFPRVSDAPANEALSLEAALILDAINQRFPLFKDGRRNRERANIPRSWLAKFGTTRFSLSQEWEEFVYERSKEDCEWVRRTFGIVFPAENPCAHSGGESTIGNGIAEQIGLLLHQNARLIDHCIRDLLRSKSEIAERDDDRLLAARLLESALQLDPGNEEMTRKLSSLAMSASSPEGEKVHQVGR